MTSSVKVSAHCPSTVQVRVDVHGDGYGDQDKFQRFTLEDGQEQVFTIHGNIAVLVEEVQKP
jgi:hypothetical protein